MSEVGTGYIIQVNVDSSKGIRIRDLNFKLEFYVYNNRRAVFGKNNLVHIQKQDGDMYFALLDSAQVGAGRLNCRVTIDDPVGQWAGGIRPVIINKFTGKTIGGTGGNSLYSNNVSDCDGYDEGFRVSFNFVYGIPKADVAYIFYGHIIDRINDFSEVTSEMLVNPENHIMSVSAGKLGKTSVGKMQAGSRVLVLIPEDTSYVATKDNGIGGKVRFNEQILGANGGVTTTIDGVVYRVYGELLTVNGELFIYID